MRGFPGDRVDLILETLLQRHAEFLFHQGPRIRVDRPVGKYVPKLVVITALADVLVGGPMENHSAAPGDHMTYGSHELRTIREVEFLLRLGVTVYGNQ